MKVGFLINPVAGMGGSVALKGTDGEDTLRLALERGAVPMAGARAAAAVSEFAPSAAGHVFITPAGPMGEDVLNKFSIAHEVICASSGSTTAADTKRAAKAMAEAGAELIIFAGGDGTARDICSVVGETIPVVGIPAGVKIHSGVYAKRPKDAGRLIRSVLDGKVSRFAQAEVEDIDEEAFRQGIVRARLYGYMTVPDDRQYMQGRKTGSGGGASESAELAAWTVSQMKRDHLYLIGSGSTMAAVLRAMNLDGTLLGVDAVLNGDLVGRDLTAAQIAEILSGYEAQKRHLVITIIGGQGHIFGRGNQQLSPAVLRMIPAENITVIATPSKMAPLIGRSLTADTGDEALDEELCGYIKVVIGTGRSIMAKIG